MDKERINHTFPPFIFEEAKIIILGSFPSVKSRESNFYYMHPQNRFYRILSNLFGEDVYSYSIDEKKSFLIRKKIALYDVVQSCIISGSSDSSIKEVEYIDLDDILLHTNIQHIFLNGSKAASLFIKHFKRYQNIATILPSTASTNAKMTLDELTKKYQIIIKYLL